MCTLSRLSFIMIHSNDIYCTCNSDYIDMISKLYVCIYSMYMISIYLMIYQA